MIRLSVRFASAVALAALSISVFEAAAQQNVPPAPAQTPANATPSAPTPTAPVFPKPSPENFTAASPSKDTINAFLQTSWGYDETRMWQVQAILKTPVEGISKVVVLVGDKSGKQKPSAIQFFALPDGKHIIAGEEILPFGEHPYTEARAMLQEKADGPYRGAATKDLEIVEFADFQCPHCKDAQANMDKIAVDFPKARIVFENYPLERIHPQAKLAAEYSVCVAKAGGSDAFFQFASAVFDGQDGLASADGAILTLNSAATKAGQDPAKIAACATTPQTSAAVESSVKLAQDLDIQQTPTLVVNGRQIPVGGAPYDTIKQVIEYQEKLDGLTK
ncbi:MAG: thioredoxin domain-containing protein [Terracidiphilus sp.]